jgi:tetratricopeptide (TPR) repeat protein
VDAHRVRGYVLEKQGRYGEAIGAYQGALDLAPHIAFLYNIIARNYRFAGNYDAAIKQFQRATELEPGRADTLDDLGWTYYQVYQAYGRAADLERAIQELDQATKSNPDYANTWAHLGIAYYSRRNYEDASDTLQKAIDMGGNKIEYYYILGLAYFYLDKCNLAMPLFQKALAIDPNDANAHGGINLCLGVTATPLPPTRKP